MAEVHTVHVYPIGEEDRHILDLTLACGCDPKIEDHKAEDKPYILVIHNELGPRLVA